MVIKSSLLLVTMIVSCRGDCQIKPPQDGYTPDLMQGVHYLIAVKRGFNYQMTEAKCVACYIPYPNYYTPYSDTIIGQDGNGNMETISNLIIKDISPGLYAVSGDDQFEASVIGFLRNKVNIVYSCNPQDGDDAVWIYSSSRVNGLKSLEPDVLQFVQTTLKNNNIPIADLQDIDNNNCT